VSEKLNADCLLLGLNEQEWYGWGYALSEFAVQNTYKYINGSLAFLENPALPNNTPSGSGVNTYHTIISTQYGVNSYTKTWDVINVQEGYNKLWKSNMPPVGTGFYTVYKQYLDGTLVPNPELGGCYAIIDVC
jgi:hypothetical protein